MSDRAPWFDRWTPGGRGGTWFTVAFVILLLLGGIYAIVQVVKNYDIRTTEVTVCTKERTAVEGGGEYRIYTATDGVFVMVDAHTPRFRTDTADAYGRLKEGTVYKIEYNGMRFSPASDFPNILSATAVTGATPETC